MSTKVVKQKRTMSETSATVWEQEGKGGAQSHRVTEGRSALLLYTVYAPQTCRSEEGYDKSIKNDLSQQWGKRKQGLTMRSQGSLERL